jgi:hypothetical protein
MKTPAPKIHLLDVDEPLVCFNGLKVRCGVELAHADTRYMFGEGATEDDISERLWIQTCKDCWNLPPANAADKRKYVYGLMESHEAESEMHSDL